jgi:hypothetical protein
MGWPDGSEGTGEPATRRTEYSRAAKSQLLPVAVGVLAALGSGPAGN